LRTLVATAPSARKIGLSSMILVSSMVRSSLAPSKPGVMIGTTTGARGTRVAGADKSWAAGAGGGAALTGDGSN
jgi:hypothetical protein